MKNIFYEPLIQRHRDIIHKDNCRISQVFEVLLIFCTLGLLVVSKFNEGYSTMKIVYVAYFFISIILFGITKFYVQNHLKYSNVMMFAVLIEAYSYSIFSGILYNLHSPSITVYALMVAACSAYMLPYSFTIAFHGLFGIFYSVLAVILKPEYGMQDAVNYIFFLSMSFVLTYIIYRNRLAYLQSVDDAMEQKDVAIEQVRIQKKLEEQIKKEQIRLENLINQVPTGIGIYDMDDEHIVQVYMNDAFYKMLGYPREKRMKYFGDNALSAIHPDDMAKVKEAMHQLRNGAEFSNVIYRTSLEDDGWYWLHLSGAVVERKDHYVRIYAAFSDYNTIVKAKEDLESSENTLQVALESAKVLAWRYNYKLNIITDSGSLGQRFGLPKVVENVPQAIIDMGFIAKESQDDFLDLFDRMKSENIESVEVKSMLTEGLEEAWFQQIYTPTFDEQGNYVDSIGIAIDITDQKKREHRYEELLSLNKASRKDAIAVANYNLTQDIMTEYDSPDPELKKLLKHVTANEMLGSTKDTILDPLERKKFDIVADTETMIRAFRRGTTHIEIRHHLKDRTRWMQTTFDMIENPYTGDIEAISGLYDITEMVRAELVVNQLLEIDYQSIMIIDGTTGNTIPFRSDTRDLNLEKVMKYQMENGTGEEGLRAFFRKYAIPGTADQIIKENSLAYIYKELESSDYYECMYGLIENNKRGYYRVIYSYLEKNKDVLLCAVQDMTDMYQKEELQKLNLSEALIKAEAANRAKTSFLSRVSHDMRTPLNGILGLTELLKQQITDERGKQDLNELESSGRYLLDLINDTLDVSRIESGKLEMKPIVYDGEKLFYEAIHLADQEMKKKNIQLKTYISAVSFTKLYVDAGRIKQVVMNVLGNAVKFTPEGGVIEVILDSVSIKDGVITDKVIIQDNGIGMDEKFIPHIFESFSQEDATRTSIHQGTGLGMSITKQLLEIMGGEISIESKIGIGTKVTMLFPLQIATKEQIMHLESNASKEENEKVLAGKRILLCEDHPLNTTIATRLLEKENMLVDHAENGKVAFEMFEQSKPYFYDGILMDIRMPVMDGIDATKAIRSLSREDAKEIPILAMTANAFAEDQKQTKEAGMNAHLSKPIQTSTLYETLKRFL